MTTKKTKEELLDKMLSIIRKNLGIRPSEINRLLKIPHTLPLRKTLLKRGLIRKEKRGAAVYYYPQKS
ncbi:hypothetical protein HYW87_00495 [Candidatus Roizmanbacteria bacterium]|nr:hypothetical protein [Candidatus Roizmanbacteria bacterium]